MLRVTVASLGLDPRTKQPVVLLEPFDGASENFDDRIMPISLGHPEATAILTALQGMHLPRPMTHDLMAAAFDGLGITLDRVEIIDFTNGTFFSTMTMDHDGERIALDARPSDAIALALRMDAPIFVDEYVFVRASLPIKAVRMDGPTPYSMDETGHLHRIDAEGVDETGAPGIHPNIGDIINELRKHAQGMGFDVTPFGESGWNFTGADVNPETGEPHTPNPHPAAKRKRADVEKELAEFDQFVDNIMPEDFGRL